MDFKKFGDDASGFFQRTFQKTEEALKTSERTMLDANVENLMRQCDMRQRWATSFKDLATAVIQPNPANRMEDVVLKGMDRAKTRTTEDEKFGESLCSVAKEIGVTTAHGESLDRFGSTQTAIGGFNREMQQDIETKYIKPVQAFLTESCIPVRNERTNLENARLALDYVRTQLRRSKDDQAKQQKLEQSITEKQALYNRQLETTKQVMEKCISDFDKLQVVITAFLNAQREYHNKCVGEIDKALH